MDLFERGKILLNATRGTLGEVLTSLAREWIRRRTEAVR